MRCDIVKGWAGTRTVSQLATPAFLWRSLHSPPTSRHLLRRCTLGSGAAHHPALDALQSWTSASRKPWGRAASTATSAFHHRQDRARWRCCHPSTVLCCQCTIARRSARCQRRASNATASPVRTACCLQATSTRVATYLARRRAGGGRALARRASDHLRSSAAALAQATTARWIVRLATNSRAIEKRLRRACSRGPATAHAARAPAK